MSANATRIFALDYLVEAPRPRALPAGLAMTAMALVFLLALAAALAPEHGAAAAGDDVSEMLQGP